MLELLQHDLQKRISRSGYAKLALFAGTALAFIARPAPASIIVHDLSQNPGTGVYTYSITLDSSANVETGDGFVIEDFPGLTGFSITGGLSSAQFNETSSLLSNSINQSASVDAAANLARTADSLGPDSPTVPNLSFSYAGLPVPFIGAATAILTLDSSDTGGISVLSVVVARPQWQRPASPANRAASESRPPHSTENSISVPQPVPRALPGCGGPARPSRIPGLSGTKNLQKPLSGISDHLDRA